MPAYLIAHRRKVADPKALKKYAQVDASVEKYGGKVVIRSDAFDVWRAIGFRAARWMIPGRSVSP